jgi:hypothetical protein
MFALLQANSPPGLPEKLEWRQKLIQTTVQDHPESPSFLDRLAAPTVFLQQALVFETSLDSHALKAAVADAVDQYPPFGYRLSSDEVRLTLSTVLGIPTESMSTTLHARVFAGRCITSR